MELSLYPMIYDLQRLEMILNVNVNVNYSVAKYKPDSTIKLLAPLSQLNEFIFQVHWMNAPLKQQIVYTIIQCRVVVLHVIEPLLKKIESKCNY